MPPCKRRKGETFAISYLESCSPLNSKICRKSDDRPANPPQTHLSCFSFDQVFEIAISLINQQNSVALSLSFSSICRLLFKLPRIVPDQREKFDCEDIFKKHSREAEVIHHNNSFFQRTQILLDPNSDGKEMDGQQRDVRLWDLSGSKRDPRLKQSYFLM